MAAKDKATKANAAAAAPKAEAPKYGVSNLVTDLGIEAAAVRIRLRKSDLVREGGVWGWNTKADYDSALKTLKALGSESKPAKADKAPAKAPKTEKATKASKAKAA